MIMSGRALSLRLFSGPAFYIGYACAVAYGFFGEFGAGSMLVIMLSGIVLAIFGINRALKWITGSGLFFF